jgi:hypothetical protein
MSPRRIAYNGETGPLTVDDAGVLHAFPTIDPHRQYVPLDGESI